MKVVADGVEEPGNVVLAGRVERVQVDAIAQESLLGQHRKVRLALREFFPGKRDPSPSSRLGMTLAVNR